MREIYKIVREAQQAALALCKPGEKIGTIDLAARELIGRHGYAKEFMHGLGHGVGLQIHELPVVRSVAPYDQVVLEEGMVITIEPGIYVAGLGGVRLEDTIVINAKGYENLTLRPFEPQLI